MISSNVDFNNFNRLFNSVLQPCGWSGSAVLPASASKLCRLFRVAPKSLNLPLIPSTILPRLPANTLVVLRLLNTGCYANVYLDYFLT